jgi:hypothetical protein
MFQDRHAAQRQILFGDGRTHAAAYTGGGDDGPDTRSDTMLMERHGNGLLINLVLGH